MYLGRPPNWQGDQQRWRGNLNVLGKSTASGQKRPKQRQRWTDHWYHHPWTTQPEMLRQGLDIETQALEIGSRERTRVACMDQPEGLRSGVAWAGEWRATGVWDEAWAHTRSKQHCWRWLEEEEWDHHRNMFLCTCMSFWVVGYHLQRLREIGNLLHGLSGGKGKPCQPHQRWVWPTTTRGTWKATTCVSNHLRDGTEDGTATECHQLLFSLPRNAHALLLPLQKSPGSTYTYLRITASSQGPATRTSLYQLPAGPHNCQVNSYWQLATGTAHHFHLPGSMHKKCTSISLIKGNRIRACTQWGKR